MSIKPLPGILTAEKIASPPPPPVTYEIWSRTQINGDYASVTDTVVTAQQLPGFNYGINVLGQYGQSTGKWVAVYTLTGRTGDEQDVVGVSYALPPPTVGTSSFGQPGYGCVVGYTRYLNGDFSQTGHGGFGLANYAIIASDLTNGRFYVGVSSSPPGHNNPPISSVTWILGDPVAGTGGLTLFTNTLYYPCAALTHPSSGSSLYPTSVIANWGAGALPGYGGGWVPPGYNGWHS